MSSDHDFENVPCRIVGAQCLKRMLKAGHPARNACEMVKVSFADAAARNGRVRGVRALKDESVASTIAAQIFSCLPKSFADFKPDKKEVNPGLDVELRKLLLPMTWVVSEELPEHFFVENCGLATVRLNMIGSRCIIMASYDDLMEFAMKINYADGDGEGGGLVAKLSAPNARTCMDQSCAVAESYVTVLMLSYDLLS